ncbi:DASH family cryptochrome [Marixanthomonas spongiae]|uniref:Cryptochrome DASH n=1 Tax=Marixanthomonas spongiae TaxID=2174845 RepID=A0A2U0I8M4_9FLAO|nr:DASH family cryptochrome [Marixanthomonas spongiae]PVW17424.1 DASH family cryptochrome [Marixanthomonas spongiae]
MKHSLVWFTNNIRVKDNTVLHNACEEAGKIIAVYCFDPSHFEQTEYGFKKTGVFRTRFLMESIKDLSENLKTLNIPLFIYSGKPEENIPRLCKRYTITDIYVQKEWTRDEVSVQNKVADALEGKCYLHQVFDQFLFHPDAIPYESFKEIPEVFTTFRKQCEKHASIHKPVSVPKSQPISNWENTNTNLPSIDELGLKNIETDSRTAFPFSGGETAAWQRVQDYFWESRHLSKYKHTRNGLIGKDYSSKLSAWLANGNISARSVYHEVKKYEAEIEKNQDTYWLVFELIWRDYFKYVSLKHGAKLFKIGGILDKTYSWKRDEETISNWIEGNTKYDFVNANMKELAATGFMSNRGRQNVASYFAKEMQQDWRVGASYFESLLIDYDVHSNWGNWMYNAGVGNDPRDRKFNIESQSNRYDPDNKYTRLWLKNT